MKHLNKLWVTLLGLLAMANLAQAETLPEMAINFSNSYAGIWKFMSYLVFSIGLGLVCGSIFSWVKVLEGQQRVSLRVPASMFFIGIILIQARDSIKMVEDSFGMQANNFLTAASGSGSGVAGWSAGAIAAVLGFVQILGFIAFARGWLILHKYNTGEARDGLGRSATHIVGGVMALNIKWTVGMLASTFAPGMVGTLSGFGII
jgi:hypothetical protein